MAGAELKSPFLFRAELRQARQQLKEDLQSFWAELKRLRRRLYDGMGLDGTGDEADPLTSVVFTSTRRPIFPEFRR